MSLYVLDTDHVTLHQRNHPALRRRMAGRSQDLSVTIVTVEEQLRGWLKLIRRATSSQERQVAAYQGLRIALGYFSSVPLLDFDRVAAARFEELRKQKIRVGTRDLRIAATVLTVGGILLTRNTRDFGRVPGLAIEDWSVASA